MGQLEKSYSNKVALRDCWYLVALIYCAIFSLFYLTKFCVSFLQTTSSAHVVSSNIAMYMYLALENSWHFVTPPLVSPQTEMTSEEWLQKFHTLMTGNYADLGSASDWLCCEGILLQPIRSTTQIWEASLHQYGISVVIPQMLFFLLGNQWLHHKMLEVFSA